MTADPAGPAVSVVMANYNGAAHIAAAVRSVLRQTETSIELIISDDGSSDDSLERARAAARGDPRVVVIASGRRGGPGAARNRALAAARGRWIAIVDNDDAIHPDRLKQLVALAEADMADIAADDLLTFYDGGERAPHALLPRRWARAPRWIGAADYLRTNHLFGAGPSLGYLKPLIRRSLIDGIRYDETLRIAEDFDLVMRLLLAGARMRLYPQLSYFYRKHAHSISHRLSPPVIDAMLAAHDRLGAGRSLDAAARRALAARRASIVAAGAFVALVEALKARRLAAAIGIAARNPRAAWLLHVPVRDRLLQRPARRPAAAPGPRIALLSRQRIVGATNGSSAYVLAIAQGLRDAGYCVDFIGASPKTFGRWPLFRLKPETKAFSRYSVRGGIRVGDLMIATDPRVGVRAAFAVGARLLRRIGLKVSPGEAEYAQGAPATREDMLYVARLARPGSAAVLCDYCFLTPMAPYALAFDAPVLTIMHDLMSARVSEAGSANVPKEVLTLTPEVEFGLLGQGDAVLAIQAEEAARTQAALPGRDIILVPHAVTCASSAQPGRDDRLLFVGSNTEPNIVGLTYFFNEVWPLIRAKRPSAELDVAGSVARGLAGAPPPGVRLLGVVADLSPLYRDAAVVISPLVTGSGLKIKLIEAFAAGKAVVGGSVTVQGVAGLAEEAVAIADDPQTFAAKTLSLMADPALRRRRGEAGLRIARDAFSPQAALADLLTYLRASAR